MTSDVHHFLVCPILIQCVVMTPYTALEYAFGVCIGPVMRRQWEDEHKFFKTSDYRGKNMHGMMSLGIFAVSGSDGKEQHAII